MRKYSKVCDQFWTGETGKELSAAGPEAQIVALYLLTNRHANMLGLYYCPILNIEHETGRGFEGASKGLRSAIEAGFCDYDEASEVVWVIEMAAYQVGTDLKPTDKRAKGVQTMYDSLPANPYMTRFYDKYKDVLCMSKCGEDTIKTQANDKPLRSPFEAPCKPVNSEQRTVSSEQGAVISDQGTELKPLSAVLSKKRQSSPKVTDERLELHREVWKSYSDAYFNRYGTEPVRNHITNRNVVDFCKRVEMEEAPHIARWFVTHSDAYYVRQMHPFWALLKDAEKIRSEWATGRVMTQTKARQTDRVGNMASIVEKIIADRGGE